MTFTELMDDITRGVFGLWRDKDSLMGRFSPTLEKLLRILLGDDPLVNVRSQEVKLILSKESERRTLMEQVRTAALPEKLPEGIQLSMANGVVQLAKEEADN